MKPAARAVRERVLRAQSAEPPPEGKAFEDALSANLDALYRTALRLCGGRQADAEDLLQDAVLRAFEHRNELKQLGACRSWMFTILVRTHLNRMRTERRRRERLEADFSEGEFESALADWCDGERSGEAIDHIARREDVRRALDTLDTPLRLVLVLADAEEFSHREIAAMLDLPEGTVASRLFRARRALRDVLGRAETRPQRRTV